MNNRVKQHTGITKTGMNRIAVGVRTALVAKRRAPLVATTLLASTLAFGQANDSAQLDEIVVTAQKREQSLQDVPISINVLNSQALEDLNIMRFDDYVQHLPNVSFQAAGPSQAQIYMRGVSDGGDGSQDQYAEDVHLLGNQSERRRLPR